MTAPTIIGLFLLAVGVYLGVFLISLVGYYIKDPACFRESWDRYDAIWWGICFGPWVYFLITE